MEGFCASASRLVLKNSYRSIVVALARPNVLASAFLRAIFTTKQNGV